MKYLVSSMIFVLLSAIAFPARAELKPNQVAIIAMSESEASKEMADYYAKARGIPESHIFLLEGSVNQRITRYDWEETYRPAILTWLKGQDFVSEIRCLVTMWDVPLEISAINSSSPAITERVAYLRQVRTSLVQQAAKLIRMLHTTAGQADAAAAPFPDDISLKQLHVRFGAAIAPVQGWLRKAKTPDQRLRAGRFIDRVLVTISGNQGMVRLASPRSKSVKLSPQQRARLAFLTGRAEGYQRGMLSLNMLRGTIARDEQAIELSQAIGGLFGAIQWIDQQLHLLGKNFTVASFDSELSMLLWSDPPILSWTPNPWHYQYDAVPVRRQTTLMVSRLSAPTPQIVRRMIDDAITAEKTSLAGKVYLDARGLSNKATNNVFSRYDQSLRDLAERLRKHSTLEVVLDNEPDLFSQGRCPEAALYCGWHSPEMYIDAFSWSTGAVGYHLSSVEATWLQLNDDNRVQNKAPWCPAMVADGACATVGACREAYINALPLPDDFFPLLLTGKYSLAEVYYRTVPYISWTTLLIGDPLYNPYKSNPKLSERALPERMNPIAARRAEAANRVGKRPAESPEHVATPSSDIPSDEDESPETEPPKIVLPGLDN